MPGFAFPSVGPLGLGSPPSRSEFPSLQPSVLCSATTAFYPSRFTSLFAIAPRYPGLLPSFVSLLRLAARMRATLRRRGSCSASTLHLLASWGEIEGSPKFPSCPFEHMPCSPTPVVSSRLALTPPGLLPSAFPTASAFSVFLFHDNLLFRGSFARPMSLLHPVSHVHC